MWITILNSSNIDFEKESYKKRNALMKHWIEELKK